MQNNSIANFYKLVYIKGISRFDTWRFENKIAQYDYFDSLTGYRVEDYYPPHYTNSIRFDKNAIDYALNNYNYVLLYFSGKYYCYFIDDISYINEDVFELKLSMDTIQTYMFDINFTYATVNRQSIKRWNNVENLTINRNYRRENLSKEEFVKDNYQIVSNDMYGVIVQCTKATFQSTTDAAYLSRFVINDALFSSGFYYLYIPFPFHSTTQDANFFIIHMNLYNSQGQQVGNANYVNIQFNDLIEEPSVTNVWIVNDYHIHQYLNVVFQSENVETQSDGTKWYHVYYNIYASSKVEAYIARIGDQHSSGVQGILLDGVNQDFITDNYNVPLAPRPNRQIGVAFNKMFIPQLLDENYYHIYFGEKTNYTTYPLYKSYKADFTTYSYYDILTGERTYKLLPTGENDDNYNVTINSTTLEQLELFNDAWKSYESQNRATLTIGRATQGIKSLFDIGVDVGGFAMSQTGRKVFNKTSGTHPAKFARALASPVEFAASEALNEVSNQLNYIVTEQNLKHTPDTVKQGNNYSSDIVNRSINVIKYSEHVKDIDNVAKLLEEFGYSVDLTYNNENLFNITNRYYFNIIRCEAIKIDNINCIIPEIIKQEICNRFIEGLRLWDKEHNVDIFDNINYDNVENDFIQQGGN